jgi:hypothetical protein
MAKADLIPRNGVESSNLASIGYNRDRRVLAIEFKSGAIFHYRNVEEGLYERFLSADSLGSFFYHHVKGRFPADKMTGPCHACGINGVLGEVCTDCGCGIHVATERREGDGQPETDVSL